VPKKLMFVVAVLSSLAPFAGCAGRDLEALCDATQDRNLALASPEHRAALWARAADDRLSRFGGVRKAFTAIAGADPRQKYALLKQAAAEVGHPEWECPALKSILERPVR